MAQGPPVTPKSLDDAGDLATFGYRQELDRRLGSFSAFAAGFSYLSILTGVFQVFPLGFAAAGPAFFWTWPAVLLGQTAVALCFAELSAQYPLSGGIYQWSAHLGGRRWGVLTGFVALGCAIVSLAAVAVALEATLPMLSSGFQLVGAPGDETASGKNAVLLGCVLVGLATLVNLSGVRVLGKVNSLGTAVELVAAIVLLALLALAMHNGPELLLRIQAGSGRSSAGAMLAASLASTYVLYGFDAAAALSEETRDPRRRAPAAILGALLASGLAGGALIIFGLLAAAEPTSPTLGKLTGGLALIVKSTLGSRLGTPLLGLAAMAVFFCAVSVQSTAGRLIFAMARDGVLPWPGRLSRISPRTRTPVAPLLLVGSLALGILLANLNHPRVVSSLCSLAVVWANLAYLMTNLPILLRRFRGSPIGAERTGEPHFSLGRLGLAVNLAAVCFSACVVVNIGWPRVEIHGEEPLARYAAPIATASLLALAFLYDKFGDRQRSGILPEHAATPGADG